MVSKTVVTTACKTTGYPLPDTTKVLEAIYNNTKLESLSTRRGDARKGSDP